MKVIETKHYLNKDSYAKYVEYKVIESIEALFELNHIEKEIDITDLPSSNGNLKDSTSEIIKDIIKVHLKSKKKIKSFVAGQFSLLLNHIEIFEISNVNEIILDIMDYFINNIDIKESI